jgi:hypothetical protein
MVTVLSRKRDVASKGIWRQEMDGRVGIVVGVTEYFGVWSDIVQLLPAVSMLDESFQELVVAPREKIKWCEDCKSVQAKIRKKFECQYKEILLGLFLSARPLELDCIAHKV